MRPTSSAIELPSVAAKRLHLTPDEANRLIDAAARRGRHRFRDKVLLRAIYRHGLRLSEATGMLWDQLDLGAGTMLVKRLKRGQPSTHTMDRDELRDLRKLHEARTGPFVFETERGGALADSTVQRIVDEANGIAKLPVKCHPHMLRHSAGYCLVDQGADIRLVQAFLGHRTPQMTMHYTQVSGKKLAALRVR